MEDGLIEAVVEQIVIDIQNGDYTALVELLDNIPDRLLVGYLSDIKEGEA